MRSRQGSGSRNREISNNRVLQNRLQSMRHDQLKAIKNKLMTRRKYTRIYILETHFWGADVDFSKTLKRRPKNCKT